AHLRSDLVALRIQVRVERDLDGIPREGHRAGADARDSAEVDEQSRDLAALRVYKHTRDVADVLALGVHEIAALQHVGADEPRLGPGEEGLGLRAVRRGNLLLRLLAGGLLS